MQFKFNIPNKITLIRVSLIPLFAIILLLDIPYKNLLAAFVFGMLSISDFLDGYFARKKKQITDFGKLIDPIADKLLISTALIFLIGEGVELWMAVTIIAREVIVTAIRIYLLPYKLVVPASVFGKAKTVVQSIAIIFVLLNLPFSWHVMVAAVLLTVISGIEYLFRIRKLTGNKIVNLPNLITLTRLLLIIPFVYYFVNSQINLSLIIFALITLGDKLDGISARLMEQITDLGSFFDSFTDWTFIFVTLIIFIQANYISVIIGILLIIPFILNGIIKSYYFKKYKKILTLTISKVAVGMGYITILALLINFVYKNLFLWGSLLMVWITFLNFAIKSRKH
ncbi:CDP-diacylglycerol--glycerol-3-phosphate 3-phosphatidyltransferase [Candidatus Woesearchaeota archaeon]|jgi:CDP-diacylglycerol--glycerol-3-phosphate 3-phosphatidyltransferase|nr:CDP-diacylglycerol--glycerol-3-phosphate 3-phosphatidyltransferase [Candidatus Woesearchaeota archaeon]MDP6648006.1 CDP-diacylglycerol--glycerol-3-phosphate 3-phosphatidyltransferase [Candidatus Woesearchaeota archaeon]|tara:strand:- start:46318 stop:47337 length:1020 start_codon:yes stop_codon:yes gene_type:complete